MFEVSTIGWTATLGLIGALIAVDLWHSRRGAHAIALREAAGWSAFYVGIALLFGVTLAMIAGWDVGTQYFAGYVVEKSLSLDNLFVFVVIMATFAVPAEQHLNGGLACSHSGGAHCNRHSELGQLQQPRCYQ